MSYPQGSIWRKWDLHVHTPASMVHHYQGLNNEEKWENFIGELEALPEDFKVIGINDYLFIDGYEKVLEYKQKGRLKNIETIFPVIEFRIKRFGGHREFKRINFHVIFSNKLSTEIIKQQFLNQLHGNYQLASGAQGIEWGGFITHKSLADLGNKIKQSIPSERAIQYGSDLVDGFNNINFDEDEIIKILEKSVSYLKGNYLTAIGKTEWDSFSWGDSSIAEKKSVINKVNFVFTSAENIDAFNRAKAKLAEEKVNDLLLDCSDSHRNSGSSNKDRIGKCFTWIKADPTFEGLKQVINEPERVCIQGLPELKQRLTQNPNKFISRVSIRRIQGSSMPEVWYDDLDIELNPSLVAIIGNKGNGKSALTDIIGLVGNSYNDNYSFLTSKKFRNPRPYNRSANIEASLKWADGSLDGFTRLDSPIDHNKGEKVKYIPQSFLEKLCVSEEESGFEEEIKKIIFSHTPVSERMGFASLDELISYSSEIINKDLGIIKGEIEDLSQRAIILEKKTSDAYRISLNESLASKRIELENHIILKPKEVDEPINDLGLEERNRVINSQIIELKSSIEQKVAREKALNESKAKALVELGELEKSIQAISTLRSVAIESYKNQESILKKFEVDISVVMKLEFDFSPIEILVNERRQMIAAANQELVGSIESLIGIEKVRGLNDQINDLKLELGRLEDKLDEPYRIYQKYLKDLDEWTVRRDMITGDEQTFGTIKYLESQIKYIEEKLPSELYQAIEDRNNLVRKLFAKKAELIELYKNCYRPISDFISKYGHMMKDYEINLSAEFMIDGFIEKFFDQVSQGAKGTYIGIEEGNKYLSDLIPSFDFNDVENVVEFLASIRESLLIDKRPDQKDTKRELEQQLRKGYTKEDFYRLLYSLDYLKPTFRLNLGSKTISELSPGERGALLLIFYLFLDKDDRPLIIDQPEENLDNQSVYNYLVHFIKEAKKRRQIIIVTHNPNLAVVCDAEQVIHMSIDKQNNNVVSYKSGAIEDPILNKTIVDILEGTRPAFKNRTDKYASMI